MVKDLTEDELLEFQTLLSIDPTLAEDLRLSTEVEEALQERDILSLREELKNMARQTNITSGNGKEHQEDADAYFGLSEEVANSVNLEVKEEDADIGNYLQQLHIKNHALVSKEIVHDLYTEEVHAEPEHSAMPPEDESLFAEIRDAMAEKELMDLRANLQSIAQSISVHKHSMEEIEKFIHGELDQESESMIREEAIINPALSNEILLHSEIDNAVEEQDIMKLRAGLKKMMKNEYSHSRSVEEIESYLADDLEEQALVNFEDELLANPGLADDLTFHKEVNQALGEVDIMKLRAGLQQVAQDERNRLSEKLGVSPPRRKHLFWYAAASVVLLMLTFSSLLRHKTYTSQQLYSAYYQPYKDVGHVSRSATSSMNQLNVALAEMDKGNYPAALNLLKSSPPGGEEAFCINFYSGVAYQEIGEFQNAINSFTKVVDQGDNLLVEQSEWFIGLCYLRIEEREKARAQFRSIVAKNGFYRDQSVKLLKQME